MRLSILYLLCVFSNIVFAQRFQSRSLAEKKWALTHPVSAIKVKKIYKNALPIYQLIKQNRTLDTLENGGKLDAFRHVFFMAAFAQKIKPRKVLKLGIAHEKGNYHHFKSHITEHGEIPDSLSTVMDLENNYKGIELGVKNKNCTINELAGHTLALLVAGNALYFKRNAKGEYVDCNNHVINMNDYKQKWFIPKCLIKTNE